MLDERIAIVNMWIHGLFKGMREDPYCLEIMNLSLATYGSKLEVLSIFTEIALIEIPVFESKASTPALLGNALDSLSVVLENLLTESDFRNDFYSPRLLILTGGKPSDVATTSDLFKSLRSKWGTKISVGVTTKKLIPFYESLLEGNLYGSADVVMDLHSPPPKEFFSHFLFGFVEDDVSDGQSWH